MTRIAAASADLAAPPHEVFAVVGDLLQFGAWFPGVVAIEAAPGTSRAEVGACYVETVRMGRRREQQVTIRVVACDAPHRLATEGNFWPIRPRMQITLEALSDGGTHLEWRMESRATGIVAAWVMAPLAHRLMQPRAEAAMRRLTERFGAAGDSCEPSGQPAPNAT